MVSQSRSGCHNPVVYLIVCNVSIDLNSYLCLYSLLFRHIPNALLCLIFATIIVPFLFHYKFYSSSKPALQFCDLSKFCKFHKFTVFLLFDFLLHSYVPFPGFLFSALHTVLTTYWYQFNSFIKNGRNIPPVLFV